MPPYVIQRSPRWRRSMTRSSDVEMPTLFIISNAFRCADCGQHDLHICVVVHYVKFGWLSAVHQCRPVMTKGDQYTRSGQAGRGSRTGVHLQIAGIRSGQGCGGDDRGSSAGRWAGIGPTFKRSRWPERESRMAVPVSNASSSTRRLVATLFRALASSSACQKPSKP